jgi:hypothetical protein
MNGATLQARIDAGIAKAAAKLGRPVAQYRPASATTPIDAANPLATVTAFFTAAEPKGVRPGPYGKPVWWAFTDAAGLAVGDYLVGTPGTFFIASTQPLLPVQAVQCNHTLTVSRMSGTGGIGLLGYDADLAAAETPLMTAWPASVLMDRKVEKGALDLPGDVRQGWLDILVPAWPGTPLLPGDILTDETGMRAVVVGAEATAMGWRIRAQQANA